MDEPAAPSSPRARPGDGLATLAAALARWEVAVAFVVACGVLLPGIAAYTLIDPWETHYAEVARRMLQDHDWVFLRWQDESFRSKPVLTFWMMAAGLRAFGVGAGGGYSGEMIAGDLPVLAL